MSDDDTFPDLFFHPNIATHELADTFGEWTVELSRDPDKLLTPTAVVVVRHMGAEITRYTGSLERAQGYAQGYLDALRREP